jgi:hypothetical protein
MKLTGKCKEDFEKWYFDFAMSEGSALVLDWFYKLNHSMQYGVYVDFFDSVDIYVSDKWNLYNVDKGVVTEWGSHIWTKENGDENIRNKNSRIEARSKAIEKVNNIYNERNETKTRN